MFENRIVEFPGRIKLRDGTGTETGPFTVVRDEGEVTEEGTAISAENLNSEITAQATAVAEGLISTTVPEIRSGTETVRVRSKKTGVKKISFKKAFSKIPDIAAVVVTSDPKAFRISVSGISTTSFTIHASNPKSSTATIRVSWIAVN